ncbi:MAG: type 4a pilus biogenesis protein PilO [bacterium]
MKLDIQILKPILLSLILLCGLAYLFFTYMYKPICNKDLELDQKIVTKETELRETQKIVENLDVKRAEFEKVKSELEYVINRLPTKEEIPQLLETITKMAIKSNINLISFRPESMVTKEVYNEIPVGLHIKGTYHDIGLFLTNIGNFERIITPSSIKMNAVIATEKDPSTTTADMRITAFVYKEH